MVLDLAEAQLTPAERAFRRKVREIIRQADQLTDDNVRRSWSLLEEARRDALDQLARLPESSYQARHLRAIKAGIERTLRETAERYTRMTAELLEKAHELGIDLGEAPFLELVRLHPEISSSLVSLGVAQVPRTVVEILIDYSADLIQRISEEALRKINFTLTRAALGTTTPHEAMRAIAAALPDKSTFTTLGHRAEAIFRTESNRIFSVSTQARMNQMNDRLGGGLKKMWQSAGDNRVRPSHQRANGQTVGSNDFFEVGYYKARYPRDPVLPPGESVNCRCHSVPVVDGDLLSFLIAGF